MAKSTKIVTPISIVLTIIVIVGIIAGFVFDLPMVVMISLLPTIIYGTYMAEGKSTKKASWPNIDGGTFYNAD